MVKKSPKVTVLMSVYNGGEFLRDSINSILNQTFKDFEFLIIDDYSSDKSVNTIKSYNDKRIRPILNEKNIGLTRSLNKGIELAKGEYIARMDVDDISLPRRLEMQVKYLIDHPEICVVGTWWENIDENNRTLNTVRLPIQAFECGFWLFIYGEQPVGHPCVMFRTGEIRRLGGYNAKFKVAQDADLWFRAVAKGYQFANIPVGLMLYRIHQKQISSNLGGMQNSLHDKALSKFISDQIKEKITPDMAALLRPINFNNCHFDSKSKIDEMFWLKRQVLGVYFKHYRLSEGELVKCCVTLWKSLITLYKLKITTPLKYFIKITVYCVRILQNQLKRKNDIIFPYLIMFFLRLQKIILLIIFHKFVHSIKKPMHQILPKPLKTSYFNEQKYD